MTKGLLYLLLPLLMAFGCLGIGEKGPLPAPGIPETEEVIPETVPPPAETEPPPPTPPLSLKLLWKYETGGPVYGVGVSRGGERTVVGSWDGSLYLLDRKGRLLWRERLQGSVDDAGISEDGALIAATSFLYPERPGALGGRLSLYREDGTLLWVREVKHSKGVDVDPAMGVVVGSEDATVSLYTPSGEEEWVFRARESPWGTWDVAFLSEGGGVIAGGDDARLTLLDPDGRLLWEREHGRRDYLYGVASSQDGRVLAGVSQSRKLFLYNRQGDPLWKSETEGSNYGVALSSDGRYVAVGSWDGSLYLFDGKGRLLHRLPVKGHLNRVSFSPDDRYLVVGSSDGSAYFFEVVG
jgi:WD40 repeat protein